MCPSLSRSYTYHFKRPAITLPRGLGFELSFSAVVYLFRDKDFNGNEISFFIVRHAVPIGVALLRPSAKAALSAGRYYVSSTKYPGRSQNRVTNESPIVSTGETFVDRLQFFRDVRRYIPSPSSSSLSSPSPPLSRYATFLRLLTNGFPSFHVDEASAGLSTGENFR